MLTILVAGAGKSSTYLINYLITNAKSNKWHVIVADSNREAIEAKIGGEHFHAEAVELDIHNAPLRESLVKRADIVISLMPPTLHILLAKDCLQHKKNLITSSYISDEMKEMNEAVKEAGLMFMYEMGLDPGIDHMTANKIIHGIQKVRGEIIGFKSYCGGLIAPESDNNPWHYKFSWNPKNVVTAGVGGAKYLLNGKEVEIPYEEMFENAKKIKVDDLGSLAYYPNRDSLRYLELYEIPEAKTFLRATLRYPSFIKGWNALIKFGLTTQEDVFDCDGQTYLSWFNFKTKFTGNFSIEKHVARLLQVAEDDKVITMLTWLGLFENKPLKMGKCSSAEILLSLLLQKWEMNPLDKDMVVMQHEVEYTTQGKKYNLISSLVLAGENREYSAMAKTVGLPIAVLAKLILQKRLKPPVGVCIPNMGSVYRPVLQELATLGIEFKDKIE